MLKVVDVTGGAPAVLGAGEALRLWLQRDQVFFTGDKDLLSMPIAGGLATVVVADSVSVGARRGAAFDGSDFFWAEDLPAAPSAARSTIIWTAAVAGSAPRRLGQTDFGLVGFVNSTRTVSSFGDELLVAGPDGVVRMHKTTGAQQGIDAGMLLAGGREFLAAQPDAILWLRLRGPRHYTNEISDGHGENVRPIWPGKPPSLRPYYASWAGGSSWLLIGQEDFSDGLARDVVWKVSGDRPDDDTRIACDPFESWIGRLVSAVVVAPEAVYLAVNTAGADGNSWELVRVAY